MTRWDWSNPGGGQGGGGKGGGKGRKRPVRRFGQSTGMSKADSWHRAMQGSRGVKTYTPYRRVKDLIKTQMKTHGLTERDAIRAVANTLGVKQRTVRTWIHPVRSRRRRPGKKAEQRIHIAHSTREVRAATTPPRRTKKMSTGGMRVKLTGNIGPDMKGAADYKRFRTIDRLHLPPDATERVMNAYIEGGPDAAEEQLRAEMYEHYNPDDPRHWEWDSLTEMKFFPEE